MRNNLKLLLIMVLALTIRIYHHHHILLSDEANNMLTIKGILEDEGFRHFFYVHPPLFVLAASAVTYPFGDSRLVVQGLSIAFSVLSFLPLYLILNKIYDQRTAMISLVCLSVLPLHIVYSTWAKPEGMLIFFFLLTLYLYISERTFVSGIFFGISLLIKELAIFLVPILIAWELLNGRDVKRAKYFILWMMTGLVISGWWYGFLGQKSFGLVGNAITGGNLYEYSWHYPWYYYLRNLPADLSWVLLPFFVAGVVCTPFVWRLQIPPHPLLLKGGGYWSTFLPIIWILAFYIPLSLMTVKAPWYTYLASPPMAVLIASGYLRVWDTVKSMRLRWGIGVLTVMIIVFDLYTFDSQRYYSWMVGSKSVKFHAFKEEEYLGRGRNLLKGAGKVAFLEYNPTLQYYLGIPDRRVYYLGTMLPAMDRGGMAAFAEKNDIGWFAIDTESIFYLDRNLKDLSSLWGEPQKVGGLLIYKVLDLPSTIP